MFQKYGNIGTDKCQTSVIFILEINYQPSKHNVSKNSWYRLVSENAHSKISILAFEYKNTGI